MNRTAIQEGRQSRSCPQGDVAWQSITYQWLPQYILNGTIPNINTTSSGEFAPPGPSETEDCLFLDIFVPKAIFKGSVHGSGSPVLVWIHGRGYFAGSKHFFGSPVNLLEHSKINESDGLVYVSINYRLGALGFLGGPTFQEDSTANVGFYDQRLASQWIQDNIYLFGGDKNKVTVMGESGGGGPIMHQITAFGGQAPSLFKRAIPQSPAWFPYTTKSKQEEIFQDFLSLLNVSNLAEARNVTSVQLIAANSALIAAAPYGGAAIGPAPDGIFITENPNTLLRHGLFDKSIQVMASHTSNEGLLFVPPITNETGYANFLKTIIPAARPSALEHIANELYPPIFDGSRGYQNQIDRTALTVYKNETYFYDFSESPGLHGSDIAFTFFDPEQPTRRTSIIGFGPPNMTVASVIQDYITSLAIDGRPRTRLERVPVFEKKGDGSTNMTVSSSGITLGDESQGTIDRCRFWQMGYQY